MRLPGEGRRFRHWGRNCWYPKNNPQGRLRVGAAIGVGLISSKAVEAVGRNTGAFGNILTLGIIAMALAEGLGILAFFVSK